MRTAKVYLVGAGPGHPELLTLKAARMLRQADAVIYDRLVSAAVLAMANPEADLLYAGKVQGEQEQVQSEIYDLILRLADTHRTIVRLKSGDPTVFGRSGEELEFCARHGIAAEIVPGISSALAAPAQAKIPLTYRGVAGSFAVLAGHRERVCTVDWSTYRGIDTLIILMAVEHRDIIAAELLAHGRASDLPVAFIENACTDRQRVVESTLGDVADRRVSVSPPAVLVVGEVVRVRERLRSGAPEGAFA